MTLMLVYEFTAYELKLQSYIILMCIITVHIHKIKKYLTHVFIQDQIWITHLQIKGVALNYQQELTFNCVLSLHNIDNS